MAGGAPMDIGGGSKLPTASARRTSSNVFKISSTPLGPRISRLAVRGGSTDAIFCGVRGCGVAAPCCLELPKKAPVGPCCCIGCGAKPGPGGCCCPIAMPMKLPKPEPASAAAAAANWRARSGLFFKTLSMPCPRR